MSDLNNFSNQPSDEEPVANSQSETNSEYNSEIDSANNENASVGAPADTLVQPPVNNGYSGYNYQANAPKPKKKKSGKGWIIALAIVLVCALLFIPVGVIALGVSAILSSPRAQDGETSERQWEDIFNFGDVSDEENSRPDYVIPDFSTADDANVDLSTNLTAIYESCSPSCCTIDVRLNGSPYSIGSGFVIDAENGYVATNHHVIETGDSINVVFYDGREYEATLVGSDANTDLAVLKINAEDLAAVEFGNSDNIKVGENVVAIGTPYDESLAGTMTCGIVSGIARDVEITNDYGKVVKTMTLIQTDCSINPGNSGGPLIDMAGNVIGITSLKLVDEQFEGIGFAIPITNAMEIFQKLIAGEEITGNGIASASAQIGITAYELEYGLEAFGMRPTCDYPNGVMVGEIDITSSAYEAGLSRYDIITDFNGITIENIEDLTDALKKYSAGDEVEVTVFRFNRKMTKGTTEIITFNLDSAA